MNIYMNSPSLQKQFFPTWLAPNLITFVAFILSVLNYILFAYYDYGFNSSTEIPRWVFLFSGLNVFIYYTLDGIDGKQARRTGTSTPLGELFDHGLDSYNTPFIMIYLFSLFGVANFPPYRMQLMTFNVYLNFYVSIITCGCHRQLQAELNSKCSISIDIKI